MTQYDTTQLREHLAALLEHHRATQAAIRGRTREFVAMDEAGLKHSSISEIARAIALELGATPHEMRTIVGVSAANVTKSVSIAKAARDLAHDADQPTPRPSRPRVVPPPDTNA